MSVVGRYFCIIYHNQSNSEFPHYESLILLIINQIAASVFPESIISEISPFENFPKKLGMHFIIKPHCDFSEETFMGNGYL